MTAKNVKYNVKDSLFRDIYRHIAYLCDLASFFLGRKVKPEEITIEELEHIFFSGWKNDISFRAGTQWFFLVEQQSTKNDNMPLRFLMYIAALWAQALPEDAIYKKHGIPLPAPIFIVLYNGKEPAPSHWTMRLSDAYGGQDGREPQLELVAEVYNINYDENREILKGCETLCAYSVFVDKLRSYDAEVNVGNMTKEEAVKEAMQHCIDHDLLAEYFSKKKAEEVFDMIDFEWNPELARKAALSDARDEGREEGRSDERMHSIRMLMKNTGATAQKAMEMLGIDKVLQRKYMALL